MLKISSGKCPHTENIQTIRIKYEPIKSVQSLAQDYRKTTFQCDHGCSDANSCPICKEAPKTITG